MKGNLLTKISLWWLRNYEECAHAWPRLCWTIAMTLFIVGALDGWSIKTSALLILAVVLTLNAGVYLAISTFRSHLLSLPEGDPNREEAHERMTEILRQKLKVAEKEKARRARKRRR